MPEGTRPPFRSRASTSKLIPALGVLFLGIFLLDGMSAFVKALLPRYDALELSAWRNVIGMLPAIVLLWWMGELKNGVRGLRIRQWRLAYGRGLMVALAQLCYYAALGFEPFALVTALGYTMNLFMVGMSILVLSERVGPWRWAAVVLGFIGAIMIVNPTSANFTIYSVLPICAAFLYALSVVTVRLIDTSVSNALMYMYSALAAALASLVLVAFSDGFSPIVSVVDGLMILTMGILGGCGVLCMLIAVRMAEPSKLAPFNYLGLISAFAMGWLFFGEAPFGDLFPGVILLVGGGLLILWRERVNRGR
ncbi:MAG: DMT family transporter [Pseudomonadota bacterium]